ncbi:MAG: acetoacetate--CoA ligase, partial [Reinekea forsetii]|nr:acetoacetate--CoA ligase [Reinekea forsetii]
GKIQAANLGMAIESWNDEGKAVIDQRGELVCTAPAPCMPLGFWQDDQNRRYHAAYFERFPGVWAQGDFCSIDEQGQVVILGRSDTTLNPGGVRIGTAEIYRQVDGLTEIADSLVVGRATTDDVEVVLFVELAPTIVLDDGLRQRIRQAIRSNTTPRHVPSHILEVAAIPYTRSGKKVELAVTQILRGEAPQNLSALANAECLEQYRLWAEHLNKGS